MQFLNGRLRRAATAGLMVAASLAATIALGGSANAGDDTNPQLRPNGAAAAPDQCVLDRQTNTVGYHGVLTNNVPYTLPNVAGWQTLKCTTLAFQVPAGQQAGVTMTYSGEFDASGPAGNTGWVQSRFGVSPGAGGAVLSILPDNTDRGDSFALDSSKGMFSDWSAHTFTQSTQVRCAGTAGGNPCTFYVYVQGQLTAGADYFWYDDTVVEVGVLYSSVFGTPQRLPVAP